jgi:uncharacterized protein (DUF2267 family)
MHYGELLQQVERAAILTQEGQAERAILRTLRALCSGLSPRSAREIAALFPARLAQGLEGRNEQFSLLTFYGQTADLEGQASSRSREQVQVICTLLAENLDPELRGRVVRELTPEVAELLRLPERSAPPRPHLGQSTLAEGKLGSSHPVSTARTGSRHPIHAAQPGTTQDASVADANPHADTKLSSSQGLTQQREKENLSQGRSKLP